MAAGIYKKGQGYWTRLMSAIGFGMISLMGVVWLWDLLATIRDTGKLESDTEQKLIAALDAFAGIFQPSSTGSEAA